MKQQIAAVCLMLAASPFAIAQDMPKDTGKKAAEQSAQGQEKAKGEGKSAKPATKKEPTEKQKAQQEKMKACSKEATDNKMKADERKAFMKDCMKKG
jgi:hypothetical protein